MSFITISLVRSQQTASLTSTEEVILSDLKQQQLKSMIGDTDGQAEANSYGIHFDSSRYVLFRGPVYSSVDSANYVINLADNMRFNSPGFDIIFSKIGGELPANAAIELQDTTNSQLKRINVNTLGVITQAESL